MHGTIEAAFIGRLGQDPEPRTSAAGKPWARLNVAVSQGDETQWVSVAVFGDMAERLCEAVRKGDRLYVEGTLRGNEWTGRDGEKRTGLSVAAWKAEKLGAIARNGPKKAASAKKEEESGEEEQAEPTRQNSQGDRAIPF